MEINVLQAVTALVAKCTRRVSRAAKKLRAAHRRKLMEPKRLSSVSPFLGDRTERNAGEKDEKAGSDEEVWRRGIVMGEKCQPLNFSGVIYYDEDGRQVVVPTLRSPMKSSLENICR